MTNALAILAHKDQILFASAGCVSGTLAEWPLLDKALQAHGFTLPSTYPAAQLRVICNGLMEDWDSEPVPH